MTGLQECVQCILMTTIWQNPNVMQLNSISVKFVYPWKRPDLIFCRECFRPRPCHMINIKFMEKLTLPRSSSMLVPNFMDFGCNMSLKSTCHRQHVLIHMQYTFVICPRNSQQCENFLVLWFRQLSNHLLQLLHKTDNNAIGPMSAMSMESKSKRVQANGNARVQ